MIAQDSEQNCSTDAKVLLRQSEEQSSGAEWRLELLHQKLIIGWQRVATSSY